jgi:hypothetical protein
MQDHSTSRYTASPDVLAAQMEGEAVLLHLETKHYFRLNETAAFVWQALEKGADSRALADMLCAEFDVAPDQARSELERLLGELSERGLIVAVSDGAAE